MQMTLCCWLRGNGATGRDARLVDIVRLCEMETNVETTKVMRVSRQPSPVQTTIDKTQLENAEYFSYLGSMITSDAKCRPTPEIKFRIAMDKATLYKNKDLFTSKFDLNLKKKIVKF
jgi:hypothetical protein